MPEESFNAHIPLVSTAQSAGRDITLTLNSMKHLVNAGAQSAASVTTFTYTYINILISCRSTICSKQVTSPYYTHEKTLKSLAIPFYLTNCSLLEWAPYCLRMCITEYRHESNLKQY